MWLSAGICAGKGVIYGYFDRLRNVLTVNCQVNNACYQNCYFITTHSSMGFCFRTNYLKSIEISCLHLVLSRHAQ
jgi:hypothetical protein